MDANAGVLICASSHLIGKINFLLAIRLLFDLALLGQLIQSLHHRLAEGRVGQSDFRWWKRGPKPGRGVQRGGSPPKVGVSHRLAQSMLLLQVSEHVLGAVGPVLFLQVPQDDPGGCGRRGGRPGHPRPPRPLPSRALWAPPLPPAAASARLLLMAFPATELKAVGRLVAPGDTSFR